MAKVSIKSERITPFGGIFHVREQFSRYVGLVIDKVLGLRCTSFGYQYGEIFSDYCCFEGVMPLSSFKDLSFPKFDYQIFCKLIGATGI